MNIKNINKNEAVINPMISKKGKFTKYTDYLVNISIVNNFQFI
jgi:hypothetical protein